MCFNSSFRFKFVTKLISNMVYAVMTVETVKLTQQVDEILVFFFVVVLDSSPTHCEI